MSPRPRREPDPILERRRHRRRRTRKRKRERSALLLLAAAVLVLLILPTGGFTGAAVMCSTEDLDALRPVEIGQNSFVYADNGAFLGAIPAERNRQPVPLDKISKWMPTATVAIEDRRFYAHDGIDVSGVARAAAKNLSARKIVEGGSTITQQLVRNLYPITRERTVQRKFKEACLAVKLDRKWSKRRILTAYMNQVYYGNHAYGVEAAARTYFSKPARKLTLKESALLAGLTQAPSTYDPFHEPARALARRDEVLRAMRNTGVIAPAEYEQAASDRDLHLDPGRLYTRIREPYFFSYVYNELVHEYGAATVRTGGLRVYTTVDRRLQLAATKAIRDTLPYRDDPASALVSIDPATGEIKAMTAVTPMRRKNQFNLVSQMKRQAGSTFKTFVLTTAIARGVNPDTTYYTSQHFIYRPDPLTPPWDVETYSKEYLGTTSIHRATLSSDNTVYAQLTLDLGPESVAATARKMGVTVPRNEIVPSIGLGAISVSPLEMAAAYATLAARGVYSRPMAIKKVVLPGGKEDIDAGWGKPQRKRVLPEWVAYEVTKILEDNVLEGTGVGAQIGRPVAGKTGTTDNHADAWFAGYTPNLQTTVWVGYPRAQIPMENVHGISVAGGTFPADIWRRFMTVATERLSYADWTQPNVGPVWTPFDTGQYAVEYVYSGSSGYSGGGGGGGGTSSPPPPPPAPKKPSPAPSTPPPATPPPVTTPPPAEPPPPPPPTEPGTPTP